MRWRVLTLLVAALIAGVALAGPASAHAVLVSTSPADGEVLASAPRTVAVTFNEPVTAPEGALRVHGRDGERVDAADARVDPDDPTRIIASVEPGIPDGTYVAAWRAISDDGHPIRGAFLFAVGEGAEIDESLLAQLLAGDEERITAIAATLARGLTYIATLVAAGAAVFLLVVARRRADLARLGAIAAVAGAALTLAGVPLQTALETGLGVGVLTRPDLLVATLSGLFGASIALRTLGLVGVAIALRPRGSGPRPAVGTAAGAVALASFLLVGHTVTSEPRWLVVVADAVHLGAGAVWIGGLVLLAAYLRGPADEPGEAAGVVAGFSRLALFAVAAVVLSGLALAWVEVRELRALLPTAYGTTLIAKVGVVAAVLAIAAYNQRRLVPAITARDGESRDGAWAALRGTVRFEIGALAAVLIVTGALVYIQPAREAAGITGLFSTYEDLGEYEVNLVVDPNRAGRNEIHLYVTHRETFRPLSPLAGARLHLEIEMPAQDVGPIVREPFGAGPGHWLHLGDELAFAGTWELTVVVRLDEFEEMRTTIAVPVNR